jgi:beta-lactamase superfamily II metal-dependent hydrolase
MSHTVTMLATTTGTQMNSFLIRTESGKTILMDGGFREDAPKLLEALRRQTGSDVPHIDAWFLSHVHGDHIRCLFEMMEHHREEFTLGKLYFNFPSLQFMERNEPGDAPDAETFYSLLPLFAKETCIVSQGDRYEIGEATFDVLYCPNPAFTQNAGNNSSVILRMTLGGKTFLFLGDAGVEEGDALLALYGDGLQSDYCQMAHHGQNGVEKRVYDAIRPKGCFWCTPLWLWENDIGKGYNTHVWKTVTVRGWMDELGVTEHYVMKDGDRTLTL